jgi:hypothetical protein
MSARGVLLAIAAFAIFGCGGSGGVTAVSNPTDRSKIAQLLKDVFAGRDRVQSGSGRARASNQSKKSTHPRLAEPEEGDLRVGQISQFGDDLWGRIEAVSYGTFQGYRSITELKYNFYRDELLTQYYGFQNTAFRVEDDGTAYNLFETELNEPSGPPYYKKEETLSRLGSYYKTTT